MKRIALLASFFALALGGLLLSTGATPTAAADKVTGNGKMRFKLLHHSEILPPEAKAVLEKAHGGFAVDRRSGKGETFFALPGAGILEVSSDLSKVRLLDTDASMKDTNMHNATIWFDGSGKGFLTFPGNQAARVFTTTLDGKLVNTLEPPDGTKDLGHPIATDYFLGRGNFVPTDTEYLDGLMYIATGYSNLDFVLTAKVSSTSPFKAAWFDLAFGGKGTGVGQFGTGHGITIPAGTQRIDVADRPNAEIERFTRFGQYLETVKMPLGSYPCDVDYIDNYAVVGSLHGPDRSKGAPIYILEDDQLISTVMIKEDLGLELFQHIHNATMRKINGKYYIIAQAWNPGDFAILEQVM
ncbi:MAG: hypothetical protein GC160_15075 [Acidobacteria bacterium]|nr:hypothetical protein [Acidobacteriota bacterium]